MREKTLAVLSAILMLVAIAASAPPIQPSTASTRGGAVYVFNVESISVAGGSGTTRTVTVALSYFGKYTLLGSSIALQPQCNASVLSEQPVQLGSWRPGTAKVATFNLDGARAPAVCPVKLLITWEDSWDDANGMNTQAGGSTSIDASITACWSEDLRVSLKPQMVYMNSINGVLLDVVNNGSSTLRKMSITVTGQGVTILNASVPLTYQLQELPAGAHFTAPLSVVPQSSFPTVAVTLSYVDCTGNAKTTAYSIPLYASQGQSILVVPSPSSVLAGSRSNVTLNVINLGSVEASNLQVILSLQGSPLAIDPVMANLGSLKPGETKSFTVRVDVPSTASASVPVTYQAVYYTPGGGLTFTQGSFTLFILQRSSLSITSIEVVPQRAEVGANVVFALSIINDGTYPVYAVNVTAYPPEGLASARSLYTFLGQLNPQVLTSVPFTFRAVKEGSYEVKFRVTYRDAYGKTAYVERTAVVEVVPASSASSSSSSQRSSFNSYLALLAVAVVAVAGLYLYRRRQRRGAVG